MFDYTNNSGLSHTRELIVSISSGGPLPGSAAWASLSGGVPPPPGSKWRIAAWCAVFANAAMLAIGYFSDPSYVVVVTSIFTIIALIVSSVFIIVSRCRSIKTVVVLLTACVIPLLLAFLV